MYAMRNKKSKKWLYNCIDGRHFTNGAKALLWSDLDYGFGVIFNYCLANKVNLNNYELVRVELNALDVVSMTKGVYISGGTVA